jgi:hypothetical protein
VRGAVQRNKDEDRADFDAARRRGDVAMIAAEHPYAPERALWSGPVDAAGLPEGVGCFDYAAYHARLTEQGAADAGRERGARGAARAEPRAYFAGVAVAGERHGLGVLKFADDTEYAGAWVAGAPDGAGVETYRDGSWYAGGFENDKRHGIGGYWAVDGFVYMGQWQRGVRHGVGVVGHTDEVRTCAVLVYDLLLRLAPLL